MKRMNQDEQILRASKEIVVKFIEGGRISPTSFPEAFKAIYRAVDQTVKQATAEPSDNESSGETP
jgi:hypothetical protein